MIRNLSAQKTAWKGSQSFQYNTPKMRLGVADWPDLHQLLSDIHGPSQPGRGRSSVRRCHSSSFPFGSRAGPKLSFHYVKGHLCMSERINRVWAGSLAAKVLLYPVSKEKEKNLSLLEGILTEDKTLHRNTEAQHQLYSGLLAESGHATLTRK